MGAFDAQKKQADEAGKKLGVLLSAAKLNNQKTTGARAYFDKLNKYEKKLEEILKLFLEKTGYLRGADQDGRFWEKWIKTVKETPNEKAEGMISDGYFGKSSLPPGYGRRYDWKKPRKPQLLQQLEEGLKSDLKRGENLIVDQMLLVEKWERNAAKHKAACEEIQKMFEAYQQAD